MAAAATAAAAADRPPAREDRPKASIDYLLAGSSVVTNPYLAAFARSSLVRALQHDPRYDGLRKFSNLKKEVTEASAALEQIRRCIARLEKEEDDVRCAEDGDDAEKEDDESTSRERRHRHKDGVGLSFVDLCSGKGLLSTMLAWEFPMAEIHMCDCDKRMELSHLASLPNVTFHLQDLFSKEADDTVAAAAASKAGSAPEGRRGVTRTCIVVGVHLCGELSSRAIQLWRNSGAAALVLSPCCLPRRRRQDVFGYHVKDQAKKMRVPHYQLWCTMLYGLLPLGEAHCNMCVDDEFMMTPYSTFVTACWPATIARAGAEGGGYGQTVRGGGGGGGDDAAAGIVPGRGAGKWRVRRKSNGTAAEATADVVTKEIAEASISSVTE